MAEKNESSGTPITDQSSEDVKNVPRGQLAGLEKLTDGNLPIKEETLQQIQQLTKEISQTNQ